MCGFDRRHPPYLDIEGCWSWHCLLLFTVCVSLGFPGWLAAGSGPHSSDTAVLFLVFLWIRAPAVWTDRELIWTRLSGCVSLCAEILPSTKALDGKNYLLFLIFNVI